MATADGADVETRERYYDCAGVFNLARRTGTVATTCGIPVVVSTYHHACACEIRRRHPNRQISLTDPNAPRLGCRRLNMETAVDTTNDPNVVTR